MILEQTASENKDLAKENTPQEPKGQEGLQPQYIKGIGAALFVAVAGALYWLVMLWDIKGIGRRSRHYRLKLHNSWHTYLKPKHVEKWAEWRQNECNHCGACCEILWRCPFLKVMDDGESRCSVHQSRPLQCRTFPIDPQSVLLIRKDRDESNGCSYEFIAKIDQKIEQLEKEKNQPEPPPSS